MKQIAAFSLVYAWDVCGPEKRLVITETKPIPIERLWLERDDEGKITEVGVWLNGKLKWLTVLERKCVQIVEWGEDNVDVPLFVGGES